MIPENEMGVIVLFTQLAEEAGFEIVSINSRFPDVIIRHAGIEYRAEFEFLASNFRLHKHDVRVCDLIICWQDDLPDSILPILALSKQGWKKQELILPAKNERELEYWKQRALTAENALKRRAEIPRNRRTNGKWFDKTDFMADPDRPDDMKAEEIAELAGVTDRTARRWLAEVRAENGRDHLTETTTKQEEME